MAVTWGGLTKDNTAATTTFTVSLPTSGFTTGDLLYVIVAGEGVFTLSIDTTGWVEDWADTNISEDTSALAGFYYVVDGNEGSTVDVISSGSRKAVSQAFWVKGSSVIAPTTRTGQDQLNDDSPTSPAGPSAEVGGYVVGDLAFSVISTVSDGGTPTVPSGFSLVGRDDGGDSATDPQLHIAELTTAADPHPAAAWSSGSNTRDWLANTVIFRVSTGAVEVGGVTSGSASGITSFAVPLPTTGFDTGDVLMVAFGALGSIAGFWLAVRYNYWRKHELK